MVEGQWNHTFNAQLAEASQREPDFHKWASAKTEPIEVWRTMGLEFVQSYIDWRQRAPYEIWTTPDGQPAIELDVSGVLPGCPVEIKGFVDRVFWDPVFKQLIILDLKSGKRPPKNADQFGTYAALIKAKYDVTPDIGVAFMNRRGTVGVPHDLAEYTPERVGAIYGEAWARIEAGEFPADGFDKECFLCDVSAACAAKNGPLAAQYDPDYHPPF